MKKNATAEKRPKKESDSFVDRVLTDKLPGRKARENIKNHRLRFIIKAEKEIEDEMNEAERRFRSAGERGKKRFSI